MSGITFFGTGRLAEVLAFYRDRVGMSLLLEQADCVLLQHGNLALGFCRRESIETGGILCFVYPSPAAVDEMYHNFRAEAETEPRANERYGIYHFFARDPEGRRLEFQCFDNALPDLDSGPELLTGRRSIRIFRETMPDASTIDRLLELVRWAPSSRNRQPCTFTFIKNRERLSALAAVRPPGSDPIARAPLAVAISADPAVTRRVEQDGCIAATYLLLAARSLGLGTCWIAAMDRNSVKEILELPREHYVATVTPLGIPAEVPAAPARKPASELVRWL